MSEKRFLLLSTVAVILLVSLPYLAAFQASEADQQFGGFLINIADGHSYLAKIQQGYGGEWRFKLPYTSEAGGGAYLYLFYIGLGHLARTLGFTPLAVYHGSRLLAGLFLLWAIWKLVAEVFTQATEREFAFLFAVLGSGLGWIAALNGMFTSDFWVAEAYPFLSLYTNPHFTLGLALMVLTLTPGKPSRLWTSLMLGVLIGIVQPFGVVIVGLVKLAQVVVYRSEKSGSVKSLLQDRQITALAGFGIGGGGVLAYQYWAITTDPVLSVWHAQNITSAPGLFELFLSLSPALLLSVAGAREAWRSDRARMLIFWGGISLALTFIPWNLQRRFLTGIYVPLSILSVYGLRWLSRKIFFSKRFWGIAVFCLLIPTNLIIVISGLRAASRQDSRVFIDRSVVDVLEWLQDNTNKESLVLAEEDVSLLVPSNTGRRVIYGHPFETSHAEEELGFANTFFYQLPGSQFYNQELAERKVDYVILSEDVEPALREWLESNWSRVYKSGDREIYARQRP